MKNQGKSYVHYELLELDCGILDFIVNRRFCLIGKVNEDNIRIGDIDEDLSAGEINGENIYEAFGKRPVNLRVLKGSRLQSVVDSYYAGIGNN